MRIALTPIVWPVAVALAAGAVVGAPSPSTAQSAASSPVLQVSTGRSRLVTLTRPMSDVFIADEKIADVQVRSPTQLYIFGKSAGETTISATTKCTPIGPRMSTSGTRVPLKSAS